MIHNFALTLADVESGQALIVTCPDCGQMEIWSREERDDHGMCRCNPTLEDSRCPVCGEIPLVPIFYLRGGTICR